MCGVNNYKIMFFYALFFAVTFNYVFCVPVLLKSYQYFQYYRKEDWGGVASTDVRPLTHPVEYVVIHHTYIPGACLTKEQCMASMRSMQTYHNSLGWGDIGYNFCVGAEGSVFEGRGWDHVGIHTGPANSRSIGVCLIGDWRTELPPSVTLNSTKALIADGLSSGYISPQFKLIGHKQVMATECPGTALLQEISKWDHFQPGQIVFNKKNKV